MKISGWGPLSKGLGVRNFRIALSGLDCGLTRAWVWPSPGKPRRTTVAGVTGSAQVGGEVGDTGQGDQSQKVAVLEVIPTTTPRLDEETKAQRGNSCAQGHTADRWGQTSTLSYPGFISQAFVWGLCSEEC